MPCALRSLALVLFAAALPAQAEADAQPVSLPAEARLAKALNAFAADLYRTLAQSGDPTCSPTSVSAALLTALLGAGGTTADQLARTLHLPADLRGPTLREAARKLLEDARLLREPHVAGPRLTTACWTKGASTSFEGAIREALGATLQRVPILEGALPAIRQHVHEATGGLISTAVSAEELQDGALLVTSCLHCENAWSSEFERDRIATPFHVHDERTVEATMMRNRGDFAYAECDLWQAVRVPLRGGRVMFDVVLPRAGTPLARAEDAMLAGAWRTTATPQRARVALPVFELQAGHRLRPHLQVLGVLDAFGSRADFTGIDANGALRLAEVLHDTIVQVDERGLRAAALTRLIAGTSGPAGPDARPIEFVADRPFAFSITDVGTGLLLFTGRVAEPRAGVAAPVSRAR